MTTPSDLIRLALKDCGALGVGQTALAEDENDAFTTLNQMLAQWQRKRWLVYRLVTSSVTSTGAQSYTIGPSGNINITLRPDKLESAFVRQVTSSAPNQIDTPLEIIWAKEDYDRIAVKQLTSFPSYIYYDPAYPLGLIYPYPIASATLYSLHVTYPLILTQFATLAETIVLPAEYEAALRFNLAVRLESIYGLGPKPGLQVLAKTSLNTLRQANAQIPRLVMPKGLVNPGIYNPYSDRIN